VARPDGGDRVAVVELDPVAGDRRLAQPPAGGDEPGFFSFMCDQPEAAVLREDTRRGKSLQRRFSTSFAKGTRLGAGTGHVVPGPVQAVVAKM
jgi:hypothetical protein